MDIKWLKEIKWLAKLYTAVKWLTGLGWFPSCVWQSVDCWLEWWGCGRLYFPKTTTVYLIPHILSIMWHCSFLICVPFPWIWAGIWDCFDWQTMSEVMLGWLPGLGLEKMAAPTFFPSWLCSLKSPTMCEVAEQTLGGAMCRCPVHHPSQGPSWQPASASRSVSERALDDPSSWVLGHPQTSSCPADAMWSRGELSGPGPTQSAGL